MDVQCSLEVPPTRESFLSLGIKVGRLDGSKLSSSSISKQSTSNSHHPSPIFNPSSTNNLQVPVPPFLFEIHLTTNP